MSEDTTDRVREIVDAVYRSESRRVLATLIRLLGDFDVAEEALHDAFRAAVEQWPRAGVPAKPSAWLVSVGRFQAVDGMRRRARFDASLAELAARLEADAADAVARGDDDVEDDRLRLIFTCCHPALPPDAQIALTLREVCGLTTEEVAHAFLVAPPTVAQRIVRAKAKIRDARIPYQVPSRADLPDRLDVVLHVVYLVFNEGYSASSGESLTRPDLSSEAIRVARLLVELLPEPEAMGLLALMLLHESRGAARTSSAGEIVLLEDQDRTLWNHEQIAEGSALVERALSTRRFGPYALQAAIAAVHAEASSAAATDWAQIVGLYDVLARADPSPVVELNRAVAVAMRDGPAAGLALIDSILSRGVLADYQWAHSARADLCRRMGKTTEARASYERALSLTRQEPERRFLERRLRELPIALRAERERPRVVLRDVTEEDLPVLFAHQRDPEAIEMAAFQSRDRDAFFVHWAKILGDTTLLKKAVLCEGQVAGHVASFDRSGEREVGYWIAKEHWGKGIATQALTAFLTHEKVRPLCARVATHNVASLRVLEKCGFTVASQETGAPNARGEPVEEFVLRLGARDGRGTGTGEPAA